jgi:hypothetical protein
MEEIWKDIKGYCGLYQVSNLGRVKSLERTANGGMGGIRKVPEKILRFGYVLGYSTVSLYKKGIQKNYTVHRLVIEAFIPNYENKPSVNHINGIKTDNMIKNLEWCTVKENNIHAYDSGLKKAAKGENHYNSKLSEETVIKIKYGKFEGMSHAEIARIFGVKRLQVLKIRNGKTWKHI